MTALFGDGDCYIRVFRAYAGLLLEGLFPSIVKVGGL